MLLCYNRNVMENYVSVVSVDALAHCAVRLSSAMILTIRGTNWKTCAILVFIYDIYFPGSKMIQYMIQYGTTLDFIVTAHDDVTKWKHFPRYCPFVRGIHRSPVNSPHKGRQRGALMFSLMCARINGWVNNGEAGDLRRHRIHCEVIVMGKYIFQRAKLVGPTWT